MSFSIETSKKGPTAVVLEAFTYNLLSDGLHNTKSGVWEVNPAKRAGE